MSEMKTPRLALVYECGACGPNLDPCVHWREKLEKERHATDENTKICAACSGFGRIDRSVRVRITSRRLA